MSSPNDQLALPQGNAVPRTNRSLLARFGNTTYEHEGRSYGWFRLTDSGNNALATVCHTEQQRRVWRMPHHAFLVLIDYGSTAVTAAQVATARQSYVNALLIASRGTYYISACNHSPRGNFGSIVRIPGFCLGACASCEWKSHRQQCTCRNANEAFNPPAGPSAAMPLGLHSLED